MRKIIQVFEHQALRVEEGGLTEADFEALVRFNQRHNDKFFVVRHRSLKFTSYVGVLQVGDLTLEVLPKADRAGTEDTTRWRDALIEMLHSCGYLNLAALGTAHLHLRTASLFDLYMEAFLSEVRGLLHQGLVKKYRQVSSNILALKGRLLFSRHLSRNLVHRERFFTAHQHFDQNNRFNQVLLLAVQIVASSARSSSLRGSAGRVLVWMEGLDEAPINRETFQRLRFDRNTERYRPAVKLARLIILNYLPDMKAGGHDVLAILFDMNELFEEYVLKQLKKAASRSGTRIGVSGQRSQQFWYAGHAARRIRPDILVALPAFPTGAETVVLDTKWKVPTGAHPDDADLKQMFAYNLQFGAARSYLVYPRVDGRRDIAGQFEPPHHALDLQHGCGMWFVDLFSGDRLNKELGAEMLEALGGRASEAA